MIGSLPGQPTIGLTLTLTGMAAEAPCPSGKKKFPAYAHNVPFTS